MIKEYYFHGITIDDFRFTICGLVDDIVPDTLVLGVSITSSTDNFVKKDGRERAHKRAIGDFGGKGRCTRSLSTFMTYIRPDRPYSDWSGRAFHDLVMRWVISHKKTLLKDFGLYH
jgi:hypothetical protein